jgi:hypothetical protein
MTTSRLSRTLLSIRMATLPLVMLSSLTACGQGEDQVGLGNKAAYMELPDLTDLQRHLLAKKADRNRDTYRTNAYRQIHAFSMKLDSHVRQWLGGNADADFPEGFLPSYVDSRKTHHWKLVRPEAITPQEQWYVLPSYDPEKVLYKFSPDPNATYLKLIFIAPLGTKLIVEGRAARDGPCVPHGRRTRRFWSEWCRMSSPSTTKIVTSAIFVA